jgi:hypothetical protein
VLHEARRFPTAQKLPHCTEKEYYSLMATMTVSSPVSRDEVAKAVASKLGPGSPVRPVGDSDSFRVGKGIFHTRVEVLTGDQTTTIKVIPFGLTALRAINSAGIARKVETALQQSELHAV